MNIAEDVKTEDYLFSTEKAKTGTTTWHSHNLAMSRKVEVFPTLQGVCF